MILCTQKNQLRMFLVVVTASSLFIVTSLINPIGQISQQQYAFAQKNTGVLADNKQATIIQLFLGSIIMLHFHPRQSTHGL